MIWSTFTLQFAKTPTECYYFNNIASAIEDMNKSQMPTLHHLSLAQGPFRLIKDGGKVIELRLFDEKRQAIQTGDDILFSDSRGQEIKVRVVKLYRGSNFDELFARLSPCDLGCKTMDEARAIIRQFYTVEDEEKYGVLGIRFHML